jgi:thiamine biosynthesis protein ThiS
MNIIVNGESQSLQSGASLGQLLVMLGLDGKRIAVEVNRDIVPRSDYDSFKLSDNDTIEIVNAIGGGCFYQPETSLISIPNT